MPLPSRFRKLALDDRRRALQELHPEIAPQDLGNEPDLFELADVMVESAVGYLALPLGIATGFVIDGVSYDVPLATEEPSVVAACSYAAGIVGRAGGFTTVAGETVTSGTLYLEGVQASDAERVDLERLEREAAPLLERMRERGGGWRGAATEWIDPPGVLRLSFALDVQDAMGANIVNSVAERLRAPLEEMSGGTVVMAILSNEAERRMTTASFELPVSRLARAGMDGRTVARRIVLAAEIAAADPSRAVTHNKGIMNGITALALATGNDSRALEAAVHAHAGSTGRYRPLSRFELRESTLRGEIALPVSLGTIGGAAGIHPASRAALRLLGNPGGSLLARIAAATGLAQNLAALFALVSEGIQDGHMRLHANRIAWSAGARGEERGALVAAMSEASDYSSTFAREKLRSLRAERKG